MLPTVTSTNSQTGPVDIERDILNTNGILGVLPKPLFGRVIPNGYCPITTSGCERVMPG